MLLKAALVLLYLAEVWGQDKGPCQDVACHSDFQGQCFGKDQPDMECARSGNLCRPSTSSATCEWTNWIDRDNPSGNCDCEHSYFDATTGTWLPVGPGTTCEYSQYRIRIGTTDYSNVAAISPWVVRDGISTGGIGCFNADQNTATPNACRTYSSNNPLCCPDMKVKYCCKKKVQPCYCCRNKCKDVNGCSSLYGGKGQCVNATRIPWNEIEAEFDVAKSSPYYNKRCAPSDDKDDKDCCLCLKKKPCRDNGCMDRGGMCVDMKNAYLRDTMFPRNSLDLSQDLGDDLCRKDSQVQEKSCCKCYKKKGRMNL